MGRLFGTDGVRGIANLELTPELAFKIGRAGAYVLTGETKRKPKILVGKDTRISSGMLEAALCAGMCSVGAECVLLGFVPTPAVAYLVRAENADAGVVISASHNSFEHNGIKFFNGDGYKLNDEIEERIESIILDGAEELTVPTHGEIGHIVTDNDSALNKYIEFVKTTANTNLEGIKVAIDCANGASCTTAKKALEGLGADVYVINCNPDGLNINANCGSTYMNDLSNYVKNIGADVGIAFDGDADRVLSVDEEGNLVDGDKIMLICALDLMKNGKLKDNTLVATVMSNLGLFVAAKKLGINVLQAKVGDRYVLEEMLKSGYTLGGEQSGHVIMLEHNTTGDGLVSALQILSIMKRSGKKLSELASVMQIFPQVLINANIKNENKAKLHTDEEINRAIGAVEERFKDTGRVLVRASGTEALIRVMIEGEDIDVITKSAKELADLIVKKLG